MVVTLVNVRSRPQRHQISDDLIYDQEEHVAEKPVSADDENELIGPIFPGHKPMGISANQEPAQPLPPKSEPDIDPDESPRDLIPTTIFRNTGDFYCDFQIPIWSARQPNTVILYRPKRADNLKTIRDMLRIESSDWYPGDHDVKCIKAASSQVQELKEYTTEAGVPVAILLLPKGNVHVKILVRQRNRYLDINYKKTLSIDICLTETVNELKRRIEVMTGFPQDQQDLMLKTGGMINDRALFEYNIRDKSKVQLILQPKYTMKLRVVAFWNKAYKLEVDCTMVIQDLIAGIIWQVFMERRCRQARYVLGCILKEELVIVEYDNKRLEADRCLQYYSIPNGAKMKIRPKNSGPEQDCTVRLLCERKESVDIQCSVQDNWAMVALKSLVKLNLPLDRIKFQNDVKKLNFIDQVGGESSDTLKVKLEVDGLPEITAWQQNAIKVKLPQGSVQVYHYTDKDTVRDVKLYIEHSGFRVAASYHMIIGEVNLSNHMLLSELPLMPDDIITLVPDDFALYLHLKEEKYAYVVEQGLQTLEGLQERMAAISKSPMMSSFIFNGHLLDHNDTYLYETRIGANCAICLELQPEMIILKLRTETDPQNVSMRCTVPSHPKRNEQTVKNSKHLVEKTHPVFTQFLNWRLGGYKKPNNVAIMRNPDEENIQQPGMKPLLHDVTQDSDAQRSRFDHPETMPGHLVVSKDTEPKKAKKGRRQSAPEARNIGAGGAEFIPGLLSDREYRGMLKEKRNEGESDFRMFTPTFRHVKVGLPRLAKFTKQEKLILHNKRKFKVKNWKPAQYVAGTLRKRGKGYTPSIVQLSDAKNLRLPKIAELGDEGPETADVEVQADMNDIDDEDFRRYKIIVPTDTSEPDPAVQAWSKTLNMLIANKKDTDADTKSQGVKTNATGRKSIFSIISLMKKKKQAEETPVSRERTPEPPPRTPRVGEQYLVRGKQMKVQETMTDVMLYVDEEWPSKNAIVNAMNPIDILEMQRIRPPDSREEQERGPKERPNTAERNDWKFTEYDDENKIKIVDYFDDPLWDEQQTTEIPSNTEAAIKVIAQEMRENLDIETIVYMPPDVKPEAIKREKVRYRLVNQGENREPVKFTKGMKLELGEDLLPVIEDEHAGMEDVVLEDIEEESGIPRLEVTGDKDRKGTGVGQASHTGSKKIAKARTSGISPRASTEKRTGQLGSQTDRGGGRKPEGGPSADARKRSAGVSKAAPGRVSQAGRASRAGKAGVASKVDSNFGATRKPSARKPSAAGAKTSPRQSEASKPGEPKVAAGSKARKSSAKVTSAKARKAAGSPAPAQWRY